MARLLVLLAFLLLPFAASADEYKPDDSISLSLSAEGWVTTKTARVLVNVNAAVSGDNAGTTRDSMIKTVNALGGGEWRLISFNRNQSNNGLENWFAQFENRLPEADLNGLHDKVKKASKPGMQLDVGGIEFTPTLAENQATEATLRKTILEQANAELKSIQATFPERGYRVSTISFNGASPIAVPFAPRMMAMKAMGAPGDAAVSSEGTSGVETSQKMVLTAQVTYAAVAPTENKAAPK